MPTVSKRTYYTVTAALFLLLGAAVGVSFLPLGAFSVVAALMIAGAKAALIVLFFMHVRYSSQLTMLVAAAGFFWLVILFFFTFSDYVTRTGVGG
jgi:cytochrome c oxidase subunit 4